MARLCNRLITLFHSVEEYLTTLEKVETGR